MTRLGPGKLATRNARFGEVLKLDRLRVHLVWGDLFAACRVLRHYRIESSVSSKLLLHDFDRFGISCFIIVGSQLEQV